MIRCTVVPNKVFRECTTKYNNWLGIFSGVFQVMFAVIVMNFFQLEAKQNGFLMAYLGVVQMVHIHIHLMRLFSPNVSNYEIRP